MTPLSNNLIGSLSEPYVNCTYICLLGNITPVTTSIGCGSGHSALTYALSNNMDDGTGTYKEAPTIEVQRSTAFHELIESKRKSKITEEPMDLKNVASKDILLPVVMNDNSEDDSDDGNPKILNLTKTKWLSESRDGSPDARIPLLTPSSSCSSSSSDTIDRNSAAEKALSTVLALDKEHNLFGLSNIMIASPKIWKRTKTQGSKGVFHQTAIVQLCYKQCCRIRSKSDLPPSLKCGSCKFCCVPKSCCSGTCSPAPCSPCAVPVPCTVQCASPCCSLPCKRPCSPSLPCPICAVLCRTSSCSIECKRTGGLELTVIKKPKFEPTYKEIVPKAISILHKPLAARSCHHVPCCTPPGPCFPYLMPCYWPARSSAPCSEPSRCFHNTPCPRGRTPRSKIAPGELCPLGQPCTGTEKNQTKCENMSCIGRNNEELKKALIAKYGSSSTASTAQ